VQDDVEDREERRWARTVFWLIGRIRLAQLAALQARRSQTISDEKPGGAPMNRFQPVFDKQKAYFNTDATKSYEWRMDQLNRIANMLKENAEAFQEAVSKDFKTALAEKVFQNLWRHFSSVETSARLTDFLEAFRLAEVR
jgi:hypothetical protein